MELPDRIQTIIRVNNLNPASFAEMIGIQRSGLSHILNGRNKPSLDFIQKVLEKFPRVDANWLIAGKSPGKYEGEAEKESERSEIPKAIQEADSEKRVERIVVFYSDHTFAAYQPADKP
jgi:transcriptional regulator with XRE-family HTH domain